MQERVITRLSICLLRVFTGLFGLGCLFFGIMAIITPFSIPLLLAGLFMLRLFIRIVRPLDYDAESIEYKSLCNHGVIPFDQIKYARVWQASYTDMTIKNVILVLPGVFNFYYLLSTKENSLVKELNKHGIEKRSMLLCSEVYLE